jgi:trimethylamine:corrinoid methyltransferase-like protein
MRTMVSPYAYPEKGFMRSVSQRYNLPTFSLAGGSDSKLVDQQAAAEAALTTLADVLMGGNIIHDLGYLESGLTYSFAQLAICNQIVDWVKGFFKVIRCKNLVDGTGAKPVSSGLVAIAGKRAAQPGCVWVQPHAGDPGRDWLGG